MHRPAIAAVIPLLALVLSACGDSDDATPSAATTAPTTSIAAAPEPTPTLRTIDVIDDDLTIVVEVADDPAERTQGLSGRDALPRDGGMLFVWDETAAHTLWMKDMRFPLDFLWLDEEKRILSIHSNVAIQPGAPDSDLVRYSPAYPARYAIELNAGAAVRLDIRPGDVLSFDAN